MAVNVTQLAAALRLGDGTTAPTEPLLGVLTRLSATATSIIGAYAPDAPDVVKDEAGVRLAGYLYDGPAAPSMARYANSLVNSGAAGLLAEWREHRAGMVKS